jgi:sulfate permease, SulP family
LLKLYRIMKKIVLPWPLAPILIPITDWLPAYTWQLFESDLIAGLTIFVFLIPQGMAYAILAGMPPVYGLYTSIVPLFAYAIFGTSQQLSLGPMAITSLLLGVGVQGYGYEPESAQYIQAIMGLSLLVGVIVFFLGIFQLGVLANLISQSVLVGFMTASAFVIMLNQLPSILGLHVPRYTYTVQTIAYILTHLEQCNGFAILLGIFSIAVLYAVRIWKRQKENKPTPQKMKDKKFMVVQYLVKFSSLLLIMFTSLLAFSIIKGGESIDIIGHVPSGLKAPSIYVMSFTDMIQAFPTAMAIGIVAFAGNWAVAKKYAAEFNYKIDATQELIAEGLCIVFGCFFNSFAGSGGLARSAVNAESGARTQLSGCIVAICMLIAVQCLTVLFYYIPKCVLGAIIMVSIISMIDFQSMLVARRTHPRDCAVMVVTCLCTFFLGVSEGLFAGVLLSIGNILHSAAFPLIKTIGQLPEEEGGHFKDHSRFESARQIPGVAIVRMDATLFFGNAEYFKDQVLLAGKGHFHSSRDPIRFVVIDVSPWIELDLAGTIAMMELKEELVKSMKVGLIIACARGIVRDILQQAGFHNDDMCCYDCPTITAAMDGRLQSFALAAQAAELAAAAAAARFGRPPLPLPLPPAVSTGGGALQPQNQAQPQVALPPSTPLMMVSPATLHLLEHGTELDAGSSRLAGARSTYSPFSTDGAHFSSKAAAADDHGILLTPTGTAGSSKGYSRLLVDPPEVDSAAAGAAVNYRISTTPGTGTGAGGRKRVGSSDARYEEVQNPLFPSCDGGV